MLEEYLSYFITTNKKDWLYLLDGCSPVLLQPTENFLQKQEPELITGQQPFAPHMTAAGYSGPSPKAYQFAKEWQTHADIAKAYLEKASRRMKKWADQKRRPDPFQVGDQVLIKVDQFNRVERSDKGLRRRYEGPVPIVERVGRVSYKLQLPHWLRHMHPLFHACCLKKYHADPTDTSRSVTTKKFKQATTKPGRQVEEILAERLKEVYLGH